MIQASYDNINWFNVPTPKPEGYFPSYTHLENSYNDSLGNLHRDFIWKNRAKVECSWNSMTADNYAILQDLYDRDEFYMIFPDNKKRMVKKIMYAGSNSLKGNVYRKDPITNLPTLWTNVSINFIEKRR